MIVLVVMLASIPLGVGTTVGTTEDVETRWRREYPKASDEREAIAREFVAKGNFSFRWFDGSTTTTKDLTVAASNDKRLIVRGHRLTETPRMPTLIENSDVLCQTKEYEFSLVKKPTSESYIISSYQDYKQDDESNFQYNYKMFARSSTVYYGIPFLRRMNDSSFVLKSINAFFQGGVETVRINYEFDGKYSFETGEVDLDPGKQWAIRRVDVNCRNKKKSPPYHLESTVDYDTTDGLRYFPRRMEYFGRTPKPEVFEHAILELKDTKLDRVPDEIFRLTAYGLPEVPLRPTARISAFTWRNPVLWLALIAAVVSFGLLWATRARKTWSS